ncbi:MAG: hypothetical protein M3S32_07385 [Acidobacteriota bacterium]|nr:hypothetical protein [Acidobacteriota bacterium]
MRRFRRALPGALLLILGATEAASIRARDVLPRARLLARELGGGSVSRAELARFALDPVFEDFLDEVARRTPKSAAVAVIVPPRPDVYRYQAVYFLAPRRVLDSERIAEAEFVAVYARPMESLPGGEPLPNGFLSRR